MKFCRLLPLLAIVVLPLKAESAFEQAAAKAASNLPESWIATGYSQEGETRCELHGKDSDLPAEEVIFEIGSISKVFTGLLLAISVEQGKVRYDSTVGELSGLKFADPKVGEITLLQLATHTSGLPRLPDNHDFSASADPYAHYDRERLDRYLSTARLENPPPHDAAYSNLGFGLLGDLLARTWDQPWGDLIVNKIAAPLGMKDTAQDLSKEQTKRLAPPRDQTKAGRRWRFSALAGAGALHSTTSDLLRFGQAFLNPDETPLKKPLREVTTIQSEAHGLGGPIGLGMMILRLHGQVELSHAGATGSYRSLLQILPEESVVKVVLANNTAVQPGEIISAGQQPTRQKNQEPVTLTHEQLDRFPGIYHIGPEGKFVIVRRGDHLHAQLTGQAFAILDAVAENRFKYRKVDAELLFDSDQGAVTKLTLFQNGREVPAKRGDEEAPAVHFPTRKELQAYPGKYSLGLGKVIEISLQGRTLFAQLTGQPAFPVFNTGGEHFRYFVVDAALEFERDPADKVVSLILHQNGEHRAKKE